MKKFLKVFLSLVVLACGTSAVNAQGLGGLINKGKAAIKKVEKTKKEKKEAAAKQSEAEESTLNISSPEPMSATPARAAIGKTVGASGIVISNPLNSLIEIEPVGLFGVSKSENYGDAYLVLRVKNMLPKEITRFGSSVQNQKMIAVDNDGKVYNIDASGTYGYDTPEGLIVKVVLDEPGLMFTDIRKDINMMQQVKFGVFSDAQHQGNVILNNVPIFWDQNIE